MLHASPVAVYAAAIYEHKEDALPIVQELLRLQVCARCCLRFVGIRSSVYSQPAPSTESLCAALAARSHTASLKPENAAQRSSASEEVPKQTQNGVCNAFSPAEDVGSKKILTAPSTVDSEAATAERVAEQPETGNLNSNQHASDDAQLTLGEASSAEASRLEAVSSEGMPTSLPPCRVCLGVLQSLDGPVANLPSDAAEALPETDGCGGHCDPLSDGKMAAVADHIRSLDYHFSAFAVELRVPASAQLRQLAMWHHLRTCPKTSHLFQGQSFRDDAVDLKETLRQGLVTEPLSDMLGKPHKQEAGDLKVTLSYIHTSSASESDYLFGKAKRVSRSRKRKRADVPVGRYASEDIATRSSKQSYENFCENASVPPTEPDQPVHLLLSCRRTPQYIGGQYRKLERDISQTPWTIDGAKKGRTSVQEEIEKVVLPLLRCDGAKFVTAGREDMDVRMLGGGRPFVLEILNQRAAMPALDTFAILEEQLRQSGSGVEACKLQPVGKEKLQLIKEGERDKQKVYEALCELPVTVTEEIVNRVNSCKDLLLAQTTPTRVAHRRALLVRERTVYEMHCTPAADESNRLVLRLRTQAGTYIKEFVHGDEGRTLPHLGSFLGCSVPASILSLDVLDVLMTFL